MELPHGNSSLPSVLQARDKECLEQGHETHDSVLVKIYLGFFPPFHKMMLRTHGIPMSLHDFLF